MAHAVVHFEIDAADDGSLVAFYKGVFGWTLQDSANGGHTIDRHSRWRDQRRHRPEPER